MTRVIAIVALAALTAGAHAATFGKLFFTPSERAQLDQARAQKQRPAVKSEEAPAPAAPQVMTYSGVVRRSDGKSILWLNHRPVEESEALSNLSVAGRVSPSGAVTVRVPQTGRTIALKPGQTIELASGTVAERSSHAASAPQVSKPADVERTSSDSTEREAPNRKDERESGARADEPPRPAR